MTRVTKMVRKKHLAASGFNVIPLKVNKFEQPAAAADSTPESAPVEPSASTSSPESKKRSADDSMEPGSEPVGDQQPGKKQKRVRHRALLPKVEGDEAVGQPASGAGGKGTAKKPVNADTERTLEKNEREALKRRTRKEKLKEKKMTCFLCRQNGHSIKHCPRAGDAAKLAAAEKAASLDVNEADLDTIHAEMEVEAQQMEGICYRCGSTEHTSSKCKKKLNSDNPYPFASCFVCKATGHLASACPKNDKGLYVNGGSCKFCGSVKHFAKDCKPALMERGVITLGKIDLAQGGDDDDVFINLRDIQRSGIAALPVKRVEEKVVVKKVVKKVVKF
ncbi:hypothetical protein HDU98_009677 [Podochytrium sp. JEL0797]|nr:hypothetical protein HDU98_009677 [Podochytrium sp. JEL0797]